MQNLDKPFQLEFKNKRITVHRHDLSGQVIYQIRFSDNTRPLVITRADKPDKSRWWTSIPQGRQNEAEEIGQLIEEYYKSIQ